MRSATICILAAGLGLVGPAGAQEAADFVIGNRQAAMSNLGNTAGMLGATLKGEVEGMDVSALLDVLAAATNPEITVAAFRPETTGQGTEETRALPVIWEDWDDFESRLVKLSEDVAGLAERGDDLTLQEAGEVLRQCNDCHDTYREED